MWKPLTSGLEKYAKSTLFPDCLYGRQYLSCRSQHCSIVQAKKKQGPALRMSANNENVVDEQPSMRPCSSRLTRYSLLTCLSVMATDLTWTWPWTRCFHRKVQVSTAITHHVRHIFFFLNYNSLTLCSLCPPLKLVIPLTLYEIWVLWVLDRARFHFVVWTMQTCTISILRVVCSQIVPVRPVIRQWVFDLDLERLQPHQFSEAFMIGKIRQL